MRVSQVSIVRQATRRAARQCGPATAASITAPLNGSTSVRFFNSPGGEPEEDDHFRKYTHKLKKFEPPLKAGKRGIDLVRALGRDHGVVV